MIAARAPGKNLAQTRIEGRQQGQLAGIAARGVQGSTPILQPPGSPTLLPRMRILKNIGINMDDPRVRAFIQAVSSPMTQEALERGLEIEGELRREGHRKGSSGWERGWDVKVAERLHEREQIQELEREAKRWAGWLPRMVIRPENIGGESGWREYLQAQGLRPGTHAWESYRRSTEEQTEYYQRLFQETHAAREREGALPLGRAMMSGNMSAIIGKLRQERQEEQDAAVAAINAKYAKKFKDAPSKDIIAKLVKERNKEIQRAHRRAQANLESDLVDMGLMRRGPTWEAPMFGGAPLSTAEGMHVTPAQLRKRGEAEREEERERRRKKREERERQKKLKGEQEAAEAAKDPVGSSLLLPSPGKKPREPRAPVPALDTGYSPALGTGYSQPPPTVAPAAGGGFELPPPPDPGPISVPKDRLTISKPVDLTGVTPPPPPPSVAIPFRDEPKPLVPPPPPEAQDVQGPQHESVTVVQVPDRPETVTVAPSEAVTLPPSAGQSPPILYQQVTPADPCSRIPELHEQLRKLRDEEQEYRARIEKINQKRAEGSERGGLWRLHRWLRLSSAQTMAENDLEGVQESIDKVLEDLNNLYIVCGAPELKGLPDRCGPDVTDWFITDLDLQVQIRRGFADGLHGFRLWAKYSAGYKWLNFYNFNHRHCANRKCRNTVRLAGVCIQKNQLGNIAFGFMAAWAPPKAPSLRDWSVLEIIGHVAIPLYFTKSRTPSGRTIEYAHDQKVNSYDSDHPHSDDWGRSRDKERADNLAAFGVGWNLASHGGLRQGSVLTRQGAPIPSSTTAIRGALRRALTDPQILSQFASLHGRGAAGFRKGTLTFVPLHGGFNTNSCKECLYDDTGKPVVYSGRPAWKQVARKTSPYIPLPTDEEERKRHDDLRNALVIGIGTPTWAQLEEWFDILHDDPRLDDQLKEFHEDYTK